MITLPVAPQGNVLLIVVNPLPVNSLGQGWRNVAPVLKPVK